MDARAIPPAALRDVNAVDLARVWIAEQGLHCSIKFGLYAHDGVDRETSAWGIILADLAGHVADALDADGMGAKADLLEAIIEHFPSSSTSMKRFPLHPQSGWAGPAPRSASPRRVQ